MLRFAVRHKGILAVCLAILVVTLSIEFRMGRSPLGPDGRFGLWEGDIRSRENSQRFADPYSLTHVMHGMLFYGVLFLAARRWPLHRRFLCAVALEASWEILENSPLIIERYRTATIALGYVGDSLLNSGSDVLMAALGFVFAARVPARVTATTIVILELGLLCWIRDNLTLNIVMLVHPFASVRTWQAAGHLIL